MAQIIEKTDNQMLDELFQAIDVITSKRINNLQFDRTITCQIVDDSRKQRGEYSVSDGSTQFIAYSKDTSYANEDWVYVTIPNNDNSQPKYIIGKYISENTEYTTYIDPFESYIDITGNLLTTNPEDTHGLVANNPNKKEVVIWKSGDLNLAPHASNGKEVDAITNDVSEITQQFSSFDRLGLRASFKSLLGGYDITQGTYGLRLDIVTIDDGNTATPKSYKFNNLRLSTDQMFGNPYNFVLWSQQQVVFDISNLGNIAGMQLVFYHEDNFVNSDNERIPLIDTEDQNQWDAYLAMANLLTKDIYISLGYDLQDFDNDTLLLYNFEPLTYASYLVDSNRELLQQKYPELNLNIEEDTKLALQYVNKKDIHLRWIHFEDESVQAIDNINDLPVWENDYYEHIPLATIHWYRWKMEDNVEDPLAGVFWEEQKVLVNQFNWENFQPDPMSPNEKVKTIIEYPSMEYLEYVFENSLPAFLETLPENTIADIQERNAEYIEQINHELSVLEQEYINKMHNASLLYDINSVEYLNELDKIQQEVRDKFADVTDEESWTPEEEDWSALSDAIETFHISFLNQCTYYESDILEFVNEHNVPDLMSIELVRSLQIVCDDDPTYGLHGVYHIYNSNGQIMNGMEANRLRFLSAQFETVVTGDSKLDKAETIKWFFPVENTMIELPVVGCEYLTLPDFEANPIVLTEEEKNNLLSDIEKSGLTPEEQENLIASRSEPVIRQKQEQAIEDAKNSPNFVAFAGLADDGQWFCMERQGIQVDADRVPGELVPTALEQIFRIKSHFVESAINNTVRCEVYKNNKTYAAEFTMYFGVSGSNGTDYTLTATYQELKDGIWVPMVTPVLDWHGGPIKLVPHVFDYEKKEITDEYSEEDFVYAMHSSAKYSAITPSQDGKDLILTPDVEVLTPSNFYHHIVEIKIKKAVSIKSTNKTVEELIEEGYDEDEAEEIVAGAEASELKVNLTTCCPITVRFDETYNSMDGDNKIIYDPTGVNPTYYKGQYTLYKIIENRLVKQDDIKWKIQYEDSADAFQYYPQIDYQTGELVVPTMYMSGNTPRVSLLAGVEELDSNSQPAFRVVWCQPLYIYQEIYASAMLNSWNGSLSIDEDNGTIMSAMIGAGFKDAENRFNGVLMGNVAKKIGVGHSADTGVFGYNEGEQSFGFRIDGSAFLGKSGHGQILFDGNHGVIKNAGFHKKEMGFYQSGMQIDLDNAQIDFEGPETYSSLLDKNVQSKIHFGVTGDSSDPYLSIIDNVNETKLLYIDDDNEYFQSTDYSDTNRTGIKFDLRRGRLTGYDFVLKALHRSEITDKDIGIILSSGIVESGSTQPYINVKDDATWPGANDSTNVLMISSDHFYMQSSDFNTSTYTGTKFDIKNGKITSYNFDIQARHSIILNNQNTYLYIKIKSDEDLDGTPFEIGQANDANKRFTVDWYGKIHALSLRIGDTSGWLMNNYGLFAYAGQISGDQPSGNYFDLALYTNKSGGSSTSPRITIGSVSYSQRPVSDSWQDNTDPNDASNPGQSSVFNGGYTDSFHIDQLASAGFVVQLNGTLLSNKSIMINCTAGGAFKVTGAFYVADREFRYRTRRVVTSVSSGTYGYYTYGKLKEDSHDGYTFLTPSTSWDIVNGLDKKSAHDTIPEYSMGNPTWHSNSAGVGASYTTIKYLGYVPPG